jgi:hypothetical protein
VEQVVVLGTTDAEDVANPFMVLQVSQFMNAAAAEAWVETALERMSDQSGYSDVEVVDVSDAPGDSFVALRYHVTYDDETTVTGHAVFLQFHDVAFSLEIDNAEIDAVAELATIQLECLEDGVCLDFVPVPNSLLVGTEGS